MSRLLSQSQTVARMSTAHLLLRTCAQHFRHTVSSTGGFGYTQSIQASAGLRLQHSTARPTSTQGVQQPGQADPFTSSLQNKTEKELLDQVLKQAQQEELAEEAAEKVTACINIGDLMRHPVLHDEHCINIAHRSHNQLTSQSGPAKSQMFLCLLQKRVNERGEHGGPKGEEPTRFGKTVAVDASECLYYLCCASFVMTPYRRLGEGWKVL